MQVARDEVGELLLAPALGAGGPHRQHEEARLGGRIPHADFGVLRQRRRRNRRARRAGPSPRASGRARTCTRPAAGRAPPTGSRSTACTRPCCGAAACSRPRPDGRRRGSRGRASRPPWWRPRAAPAEGRIGPGLGDDARAVVRADLGLVGLDDGVERGRIDVALLGQHGSSARTRSCISDSSEPCSWSWSWSMIVVIVPAMRTLRSDFARYITMNAVARHRSRLADRDRPPQRARSGAPRRGARLSIVLIGSPWCCCATCSASARSGCRIDHLRATPRCSCWPPPGRCGRAAMCGSTCSMPTRRRAPRRGRSLRRAVAAAAVRAALVWFSLALCGALLGDPRALARDQRPAAGVPAQDADPAVRAAAGAAGIAQAIRAALVLLASRPAARPPRRRVMGAPRDPRRPDGGRGLRRC